MSLLFIYLIAAIVLGGICMWLSGLTTGLRFGEGTKEKTSNEKEERLKAEAKDAFIKFRDSEIRANKSEKAREAADTEASRLTSELDSMKAELARVNENLTNANEDNESLKREVDKHSDATRTSVMPPVPPPLINATEGASEEADNALAELDLERVAHRKTKDELDKKKAELDKKREELAALKNLAMAVSPPPEGGGTPLPRPGGRRGAGFQTVSIATRSSSVTGTEHDRLRQAYDQLQREKDKVESDLARAQQELQLLKMRQ